jgi:MscS family membrane protein
MNLFQFKILDNDPVTLLWFTGIILFAFIIRKYLSQIVGFALYKIFHRPSMNNTLSKFQSLVLPSLQYVIFLFIVRLALEMLHYPSVLNITIWKYPLQDILNLLLMTLIWWCITRLLLRTVDFIGYTMYNRALPAEVMIAGSMGAVCQRHHKDHIVCIQPFLFLLGVVFMV